MQHALIVVGAKNRNRKKKNQTQTQIQLDTCAASHAMANEAVSRGIWLDGFSPQDTTAE